MSMCGSRTRLHTAYMWNPGEGLFCSIWNFCSRSYIAIMFILLLGSIHISACYVWSSMSNVVHNQCLLSIQPEAIHAPPGQANMATEAQYVQSGQANITTPIQGHSILWQGQYSHSHCDVPPTPKHAIWTCLDMNHGYQCNGIQRITWSWFFMEWVYSKSWSWSHFVFSFSLVNLTITIQGKFSLKQQNKNKVLI